MKNEERKFVIRTSLQEAAKINKSVQDILDLDKPKRRKDVKKFEDLSSDFFKDFFNKKITELIAFGETYYTDDEINQLWDAAKKEKEAKRKKGKS